MPAELRREGEAERMSEALASAGSVDTPKCPRCASARGSKRFGTDRNGAQRFRCNACWKVFTSASGAVRGHYKKDAVVAAKEALLSGLSIRRAAKVAGLCKRTVEAARNEIKDTIREKRCECGGLLGHRGWCSVRYAQSPARQAFIAKWTRANQLNGLRPGAFFLGFMSCGSLHVADIPRGRRCESRSCPFPALYFNRKGMHVCRYHLRFFYYKFSMTDSRLGWEDTHDSEDQTAPISVVEPWDNNFVFELKGTRKYERSTLEELTV